ncbi:arsenate reductase/protein-tyrosine-phosphatase family protein [Enterobacter asburiae]|uniref:arsenate reductase/protein-tyrosine-phosphatase family protein n=2 Tax=Enterobacter asburiae TaxID=61645 RepID=UPI001F3AD79B|nr:protein tyrosine phosphatase [Enterobacter asburiae]
MNMNSVLVICVGNICRSPVGEMMLRQRCPHLTVGSAGIAALVGHDLYPLAREVAMEKQLRITPHQARQLTASLCQDWDLLLVMEKKHLELVNRIAPEARGKTLLFGHWSGRDIPDPYRKDREFFLKVHQMLDDAASDWARVL